MSSQLTQQQQVLNEFNKLKDAYAAVADELSQIHRSLERLNDGAARTRQRKQKVQGSNLKTEIETFSHCYYIFASLTLVSKGTNNSKDFEALEDFIENARFIEHPFTDVVELKDAFKANSILSRLLDKQLRSVQQNQHRRAGNQRVNNQDQISKIIEKLKDEPYIWDENLSERQSFWSEIRYGPFPPPLEHGTKKHKISEKDFLADRWYDLIDRVAFAFRELHGKESLALTAFRKYAFEHKKMNGQSFAEDMTPTCFIYDPTSLELSDKLPTVQVTWGDIHKALDQVVKQRGEKAIHYSDVIVAVFGQGFFDNPMLKTVADNLYKRVSYRREKLLVWFRCPKNPSTRGSTKRTLAWIPKAWDLVEYAQNMTAPGEVRLGYRVMEPNEDGNTPGQPDGITLDDPH